MKNIKTVCISGGFDPLHVGHIRYIKEAQKLGDYLIIILNQDSFLVKKKGKAFMPFEERKEILFAIEGVDEVFGAIDEDMSVCETLRLLKPDIFAKGGDRTMDNIPEKEVCDELGITMVFDVGGGKIQSSSSLIKNYND